MIPSLETLTSIGVKPWLALQLSWSQVISRSSLRQLQASAAPDQNVSSSANARLGLRIARLFFLDLGFRLGLPLGAVLLDRLGDPDRYLVEQQDRYREGQLTDRVGRR